jgi:thioredoxin reductase (NADPH)
VEQGSDGLWDCAIVGGGPAGLTAAIYLARFHLSVVVIDAGRSRAASIPVTHNHAGFPGGIAGTELLMRMRAQAVTYGARVVDSSATALTRHADGGFAITSEAGDIGARSVLLATGVVNIAPEMPTDIHDDALACGLLRYCPICDGFEVTDKRIAVFGSGGRGAREALFLRSYSKDITLLVPEGGDLPPDHGDDIRRAGITIVAASPGDIAIDGNRIAIATSAGVLRFDTLYPALGSAVRSELAVELGAERSQEGCLKVDAHQRTSLPGLYAAGDVVLGLDQISHAMGEGGVAATTIRNDLAEKAPLWR